MDVQIEVPFFFPGNIRGCSPFDLITEAILFLAGGIDQSDLFQYFTGKRERIQTALPGADNRRRLNVGQGIAKAAFTFSGFHNGVPVYNFTSVRYDFREIPEPLTIALLASGLLGLGVRLRARRKN